MAYSNAVTSTVMAEYVNDSTSTSSLAVNSAAAADPLIVVIIILSVVVAAAILFVICGLFLKAEAHLRSDREATMDSLLVEPMSRLTGES